MTSERAPEPEIDSRAAEAEGLAQEQPEPSDKPVDTSDERPAMSDEAIARDSTDLAPTSDGVTAAAPPADAASGADPAEDAVSVSAPGTVALADTTPQSNEAAVKRRAVFLAGLRRAVGIAFALAVFGVGIALGTNLAQANRPVPITANPIDPAASPPAVAQEFIRSLASNDMDALRSSLEPQPHKDITNELQRFNIQRVERVETLKTQVDGSRSATEIMMITENTDGVPFTINLVILVDGGKIEGFR